MMSEKDSILAKNGQILIRQWFGKFKTTELIRQSSTNEVYKQLSAME